MHQRCACIGFEKIASPFEYGEASLPASICSGGGALQQQLLADVVVRSIATDKSSVPGPNVERVQMSGAFAWCADIVLRKDAVVGLSPRTARQ
jgi:hypothetical protein